MIEVFFQRNKTKQGKEKKKRKEQKRNEETKQNKEKKRKKETKKRKEIKKRNKTKKKCFNIIYSSKPTGLQSVKLQREQSYCLSTH